jgi:hypothetical protein
MKVAMVGLLVGVVTVTSYTCSKSREAKDAGQQKSTSTGDGGLSKSGNATGDSSIRAEIQKAQLPPKTSRTLVWENRKTRLLAVRSSENGELCRVMDDESRMS